MPVVHSFSYVSGKSDTGNLFKAQSMETVQTPENLGEIQIFQQPLGSKPVYDTQTMICLLDSVFKDVAVAVGECSIDPSTIVQAYIVALMPEADLSTFTSEFGSSSGSTVRTTQAIKLDNEIKSVFTSTAELEKLVASLNKFVSSVSLKGEIKSESMTKISNRIKTLKDAETTCLISLIIEEMESKLEEIYSTASPDRDTLVSEESLQKLMDEDSFTEFIKRLAEGETTNDVSIVGPFKTAIVSVMQALACLLSGYKRFLECIISGNAFYILSGGNNSHQNFRIKLT